MSDDLLETAQRISKWCDAKQDPLLKSDLDQVQIQATLISERFMKIRRDADELMPWLPAFVKIHDILSARSKDMFDEWNKLFDRAWTSGLCRFFHGLSRGMNQSSK